MSYRENDIAYENPKAWVLDDKKHDCYTVFRIGVTHSTSDSSYARNADGLGIAKARADFFDKPAQIRVCNASAAPAKTAGYRFPHLRANARTGT